MKNSILLSFFLTISNIVFAQDATKEYITITEKDTLCWERSDSSCTLVLHKSDESHEKILVFGQPSPSDKLKSIKFEDTLCGILTKSPVETTYFLVKKTGATWKIIKFFGWDFFGITDDHPNTILSITLDSARQITVIKTDNTVEITSLDAKGKVIVTTKKE